MKLGIGDLEAVKNRFIHETFENTADEDYLCARVCFKLRLLKQFWWSGLQAVEKYMKTILLYHGKDTRNIGHKISTKGIKELKKIDYIPWDFDDLFNNFIDELEHYGQLRYFQAPIHITCENLYNLDNTIWQIRRFCINFPFLFERENKTKHRKKGETTKYINYLVSDDCKKKPQLLNTYGKGYLEYVLYDRKFKIEKSYLIWRNNFFGYRKRRSLNIFRWSIYKDPSHFVYPELFNWLKDKVKFEKPIADYLQKEIVKNNRIANGNHTNVL